MSGVPLPDEPAVKIVHLAEPSKQWCLCGRKRRNLLGRQIAEGWRFCKRCKASAERRPSMHWFSLDDERRVIGGSGYNGSGASGNVVRMTFGRVP